MTKPDKPLEAKGCGCGLIISIILIGYALHHFLGIGKNTALYIAFALGVISIIAYLINEHKAQRVLDNDYKKASLELDQSKKEVRDEISCPFCGEKILRIAVKCKHCGSMINDAS